MAKTLLSYGESGIQRKKRARHSPIMGPQAAKRLGVHQNTTHGLSKTPEYGVWSGMVSRCTDPNNQAYKDYGGRGIKVCEEWKVFKNFIADVGWRPSPELELNRINNNGHYEPGNVEWTTAKRNNRNRRNNRYVIIDGVTKTVAEWAEHYGMKYESMLARANNMRKGIYGKPAHQFEKGSYASAELTPNQVREIRRKYKQVVWQECVRVGKQYGVGAGAIYCILRRKTWKGIE